MAAGQPRFHLDLPPDWKVIRTQSSTWYEDVDALLNGLPNEAAIPSDIRDELHGLLDSVVYRARAAGAIVMAMTIGRDRDKAVQLANLVVSMTSSAPHDAELEPVRLALADAGVDDVEEFDTPSGTAIMATELIRNDQAALADLGFPASWQATSYLPVPGSPFTLLSQVQVTGRKYRSRDLAQSVAARLAHTFWVESEAGPDGAASVFSQNRHP